MRPGQNEIKRRKDTMEKRTKLIVMLMAMVAVLAASSTLAQRNYDLKTVETIGGKVLSIEKTTATQKRGYGVHLTLQTDKETNRGAFGTGLVYRWYIEKQTPKIEANDTITVTGSRVIVDGNRPSSPHRLRKEMKS
jgi:hypothetical protein